MIKFNKLLFPVYAYKQYKELWDHVYNLESVMDWVVNNPTYSASEKTGFNGQMHRKAIVNDLLSSCSFQAILETGTYTGDTTGYLSQVSNLPVYTCELNKWFYNIAQMRLKDFQDIHYTLGDSRQFLKNLASNDIAGKNVFIYLDSHWYTDLPLKEELQIISEHWNEFVIMIDDFQVPDDPGYDYDFYTRKKSLRMKTFGKLFKSLNLSAFFPVVSSVDETGYRRGCVVLAPEGKCAETLRKVSSLREVESL